MSLNSPRRGENRSVSPWAVSPFKRLLDLLLAFCGIVALAPVLLFVAAAVRSVLGTPVLFRQRRVGLGGAEFEILKFRTMRDLRDSTGRPLNDAQRLTRFGRGLRASSLDELPELLNVLRGDMSLVGPRPLLPEYLPLYSNEQRRRHNVRPGLTGWAQVNGRNATTWEKRFEDDVWYVNNASFSVDARILLKTFFVAVSREGVSESGEVTMRPFRGSSGECS